MWDFVIKVCILPPFTSHSLSIPV